MPIERSKHLQKQSRVQLWMCKAIKHNQLNVRSRATGLNVSIAFRFPDVCCVAHWSLVKPSRATPSIGAGSQIDATRSMGFWGSVTTIKSMVVDTTSIVYLRTVIRIGSTILLMSFPAQRHVASRKIQKRKPTK